MKPFRLNDLVTAHGKQAIVVNRTNNLYALQFKWRGYSAWYRAEDLKLIQHDAHELLDEWEEMALQREIEDR